MPSNRFIKKTIYRYIERKYLQTIDGLILNSENTLSQARNLLGCELPPHVIAVPAGDHFPDYINTRGKPDKNKAGPGPLRILIVGSVINQKGLHVIIQTMARLQSRDYILTVTGRLDMEPAYVKKIRKLIRTLKLENQVTITGPLQNDKLIEVYQSNDIFILPSVNEAYGIVYLEAQQFGLPIIGTTAGGAKEIIKHGGKWLPHVTQ